MTLKAITIPTKVEHLDRAWFDSILEDDVAKAKIVQVIHGTATKFKVELELASDSGVPRNQIVWVKTGMEPHSKSIGTERVYAGETFFYRNYGGKYDTRAPHCYYAESDSAGNSVLVLDDLCKIGAQFTEPTQPASPERIAQRLRTLNGWCKVDPSTPQIA